MGTVHATCVAVESVGILLRGPSGSGKSDLALRLIDGGASLVADDRVHLAPGEGDDSGAVVARPPAALAGLLEVRGLGPVPVATVPSVRLGLVVDLRPGEPLERLPDPTSCAYLGVTLPLLQLDPFRPSAPAVLRLAVAALRRADGHWPVAVDG
ncbi:MAG: hypothetical protein HKM95_10755 [Inquilinus sp.]|nr:hypothetical protein [Inquilinus sp.]